MLLSLLTISIIIILFALFYLRSPKQKAKRWLHQPRIKHAQQVFNTLYANVNATLIAQEEKQKENIDGYEFVYGEIEFISFAAILDVIQPKPNDIFYDLGSGGGKAVIAAHLLYPLKTSIGIELLPGLHQLSQQLVTKLQQLPDYKTHYSNRNPDELRFIQSDFLKQDISDANIIFINATGLFAELWDATQEKLSTLTPNTHIILTSKKLPDTKFELIDQQYRLMSWGPALVSIYKKR